MEEDKYKKIIFVILTLKAGGAERVMSILANEFAKQKIQVHIILLAESNDFYELHPNIRVHRLEFKNKGSIQKRIAEIQTFWKLRKKMKQEAPAIILSFLDKVNILTILASRFLRLQVFISERNNPKKPVTKYILVLKQLTFKYATGVIAQTNFAKEILEKTIKNSNIKVIPNPVKPVSILPNIPREKIIINIGRLEPQKGQKYLLEAFQKLNIPGWQLVILGEGSLKNELLEQAKELKIDNQIIMPGIVKNVDEWLARASIFAFSSIFEGFPNALTEAMAAGLPCICFDCDAGPRDIIINGENGFLVQLKNTEEFSKKLQFLIEHPELRLSMGKKASVIKNELEISKIAQEYLNFFIQNQDK